MRGTRLMGKDERWQGNDERGTIAAAWERESCEMAAGCRGGDGGTRGCIAAQAGG